MTLIGKRVPELGRWLVAWVLVSVLGGVWAFATPLFGSPDEPAHAVYAAAAAHGQVWAETTGVLTEVTVPADFATASAVPPCFAFHPDVAAGCAPEYGGESGTAVTQTSAGRYPPAYYVYAGLPTYVADGAAAVHLMRLLTVFLVAAFVASAACSALRTSRPALALTGLGLAVTPTVLFFAGTVNPQAPEIAAGIGLWTSGYVLLLRLREDPRSPLSWRDPLVRRTLLAAVGLTLIRPLSLLWLALIVAVLLVALADKAVLRRLVTAPAVLWAVPVLAVTAGSTLVWILFRNALAQQDVTIYADMPLQEAVVFSFERVNDQLTQMIGMFGWLDVASPGFSYAAWTIALVVLAALGIPRATGREKVAVLLVALALLVVPGLLQLQAYKVSAFVWQGRYSMPLAVGVPLLLGLFAASAAPGRARATRWLLAGLAATIAFVHVTAMVWALNRNVSGTDELFAATPDQWTPPLPVPVLIGTMLVAATAAAVLVVRLDRRDAPAPLLARTG
ncbi:DUF2142 domain-containing protein [Blastococcus litoris]|uniref:DUF2142 domain-containing protein n=1 Tax=Blastococcus litoris TaxID=2171622 RepID=UPI0013E0DCC5|nr:DUF2142 domain-containing protein [Blastococcus litoris]